MRILIFSQYFWPEPFIINDFVKNLVEQGHKVTVATGKPNYPAGTIYTGYTASGIHQEKYLKSVDVYRVPLRPRYAGGGKNLILNYFSFIFSGLFLFPWLLRAKKFDHILVFAPSPIVQAIPAILLKYIHRAHLSIWVQDLWPESLSATGFVKNKMILKAVGVLVRMIYGLTDTLLVQSKAFIEPVSRYSRLDKIIYFPNTYDSRAIQIDPNLILPTELTNVLSQNFCFVFAGNLGTAQSLDTILDAAEKVKDLAACKVVIVGSGSLSGWLQAEVTRRSLHNVYIAGRFPMEQMPSIFALSKVLLVTLKDDPIFKLTVPSKIQAYLAAEKPILAAINGEGARIIQESGAGFAVQAENSEDLAQVMRKMYGSETTELRRMAMNAKEYFNKNFEMSTQVKTFARLMAERFHLKRKPN